MVASLCLFHWGPGAIWAFSEPPRRTAELDYFNPYKAL